MSENVTDERADDIRVALRLDLNDVLADVAHEALHVIMRRDPADRFTKENTLHGASDLHLLTLAHGRRFAVPAVGLQVMLRHGAPWFVRVYSSYGHGVGLDHAQG